MKFLTRCALFLKTGFNAGVEEGRQWHAAIQAAQAELSLSDLLRRLRDKQTWSDSIGHMRDVFQYAVQVILKGQTILQEEVAVEGDDEGVGSEWPPFTFRPSYTERCRLDEKPVPPLSAATCSAWSDNLGNETGIISMVTASSFVKLNQEHSSTSPLTSIPTLSIVSGQPLYSSTHSGTQIQTVKILTEVNLCIGYALLVLLFRKFYLRVVAPWLAGTNGKSLKESERRIHITNYPLEEGVCAVSATSYLATLPTTQSQETNDEVKIELSSPHSSTTPAAASSNVGLSVSSLVLPQEYSDATSIDGSEPGKKLFMLSQPSLPSSTPFAAETSSHTLDTSMKADTPNSASRTQLQVAPKPILAEDCPGSQAIIADQPLEQLMNEASVKKKEAHASDKLKKIDSKTTEHSPEIVSATLSGAFDLAMPVFFQGKLSSTSRSQRRPFRTILSNSVASVVQATRSGPHVNASHEKHSSDPLSARAPLSNAVGLNSTSLWRGPQQELKDLATPFVTMVVNMYDRAKNRQSGKPTTLQRYPLRTDMDYVAGNAQLLSSVTGSEPQKDRD